MRGERRASTLLEPGVFLVSAAMLAFEVLLLRLFAIEQFHHFAYMAIGMALLGFGASGTVLVVARPLVERHARPLLEVAAVTFTVVLAAAVPLAHAAAFDATQIVFDPGQWWSLVGVYAALALPFLCGAAVVALALIDAKVGVGRVYGANLLGSGTGSLLALVLLAWATPQRAVAAPALLAAAAAGWFLTRGPARAPWKTGVAAVLAVGAMVVTVRPPWSLQITPFKGLPQTEAMAGSERVGERWGPVGWTVAVRAPAFRHAPGLSLAYTGEMPPQTALFVDGETAGAATSWGGEVAGPEFLDWLTLAAPYAVRDPRRVLVLGSGDGLEVLNALAHGAEEITAIELNGPLVALADSLSGSAPTAYRNPRVTLELGDARTFVASTAERVDLIVLPLAGTFNATAAGVHGSGEDYLNTVEAYDDYLRALAPGGMLAITRWVRTPPRDNVKVILTAARAVRRAGADVGRSLVFLRSWAAATLLVRPAGFDASELARLSEFAETRFFDIDWPAAAAPVAGPFNAIERPVFAEATAAAATDGETLADFVRDYPFNVAPATDDRPYFGRFVRVTSLPALLRSPRGSWLPFAEWGHLALIVTLVQSAALAALLLVVPAGTAGFVALVRRRAARAPSHLAVRRPVRMAGYFGAIGFGYLFVEIAAIQRLTLVLGHPVYAAAAVLAAFLTFSGIGALVSDRLDASRTPHACAGVGAIALSAALFLDVTTLLLAVPLAFRVPAVVLVLAPLAASMGLPFPLGIRRLADSPNRLAWAWAVNGFASVVAASLAVLIAMETGTRALFVVGALLYAVAALLARGSTRQA